ncbi:CinA-like protein [Capillimicrobium parvum]|uniref:CinA-like protein n=1 Tax=Capillimicrobium parvum TaxID=2884022 RepID=A0A9E6XYL4_9ACTN|nr:competence/damage-inducible protein A [Capillimicrobium parvum]UGS36686.1 CinA-like protein [Capillimicrobium parvum]
MSVRAGVVVTGTEVLTGRVVDRNGPWLSDQLFALGVDHAHTVVVGDRDDDMLAALGFFARQGLELIITSGGLGPTEDDRTAEIVGRFQGREMVLDEATEARIWEILSGLRTRWPHLDEDAIRRANRKQAVVPRGAAILPPVGTAPGLVVAPAPSSAGSRFPVVVVLPGPPRELQAMWPAAVETAEFRAVLAGASSYRSKMLRLFGIPESEIAATMRVAREGGVDLDALEITTCLRRGEIEIVSRWEPGADDVYRAFEDVVRSRHADVLFSDDGRSVDTQVADMLRSSGISVACAESCTGGLLAARLTELDGASEYFPGGLVTYANEAKSELAGVPASLIAEHGAVSEEVAKALADGARAALHAEVGVGITGIAGPGGGTEGKPVGTVWLSVSRGDVDPVARLTRRVHLPGGRADVRDRSTTVALHLLRRLLMGESDAPGERAAEPSAAAAGEPSGTHGPAATEGGPVGDE